jgi:hypothetical protein
MADLFPDPSTDDIQLEDKIEELEKEIRYRHYVYKKQVANGRMKQETMDRRILIMESILQDYYNQR